MAKKTQKKYEQRAEYELDLHGKTGAEAKMLVDELIDSRVYRHIRVIVGKGTHSQMGPVLPYVVKNHLYGRGIRYERSKLADGGEGALEVFL
jgi:DNA-nicking Smr family endonuclease